MAKSPRRQVVEGLVDFAIGALPDTVEARLRRALGLEVKPARPLAVERRRPPKVEAPATPPKASTPPRQKALPAPPKVLALPPPGPGLPDFAVKPRGGQFYPDTNLGPIDAQAAGYKLDNYTDSQGVDRYQVIRPDGMPVSGYFASTPEGGWNLANIHFENDGLFSNQSPEAAARRVRQDLDLYQMNDGPPDIEEQLGSWLERALAKYYKTDFGSPDDPLRTLAERGLHYDPQMTPEEWQKQVDDSLMKGPIGYFTVPRHEDEIKNNLLGGFDIGNGFALHAPIAQGALMQAAPWLRKQPVTDMLYGIRDNLNLKHFSDEMQNALRAEEAGLPLDLAVRPESLDRMTFAQAAEHVGKINKFRVKQMEQAALDAQNNPVTHIFKEYTEDNPKGLRWVEMAPPKGDGPFNYDVEDELSKALKYEGDTMGHCVGGYCPDVMEGRSRIFSLRDAKGEPHVTIETQPTRLMPSRDERDAIYEQARQEIEALDLDDPYVEAARIIQRQRELVNDFFEAQKANPRPDDIIQIKGKQNRAPKDDYLPFVQDFVKSQQWGNVGDLGNTGLVRLPDGRYITQQQFDEGFGRVRERHPGIHDQDFWYDVQDNPQAWGGYAPYFEGYAIGGRVDPDRCFCHNPLSVKKGR